MMTITETLEIAKVLRVRCGIITLHIQDFCYRYSTTWSDLKEGKD